MMFSLIHHDKYTTVLQNDKRIFDILYSFSINIEHKLNAQNVADAMIDALNVVVSFESFGNKCETRTFDRC